MDMNKSTRFFILLLFLVSFVSPNMAQSDSTRIGLNSSVVVQVDYNPVLEGVSEKINVAPAINDNIADDLPRFSYSITPRRISSMTSSKGPKAGKVTGLYSTIYNNYMRFGLGHDFAGFLDFKPMADLYYMSTRKEEYAYGVRFFHNTDISSFGKRDETTPSPNYFGRNLYSLTQLSAFGKYILNKKHLFSAELAFEREKSHYYGFSDSTCFAVLGMRRNDIDLADWAMAYKNLGLNLAAKSLNTDVNKPGYALSLDMADFWYMSHFSQRSLDFDANVHYGFPVFEKYKGIVYFHTNWQGYKQSSSQPGVEVGGRHVLTVNPYVDFLFNGFKVHAGFALGFNGYDSTEATSHNFFPDIIVSKQLMGEAVSLTAGFQGRYIVNDWNAIRNMNIYTVMGPKTMATVDNNLYAHFRMSFSKWLILNVNIDNHFMKNAIFFRLDNAATLHNKYTPYYKDVNELCLGAELSFINEGRITISLGAEYSPNYGSDETLVPILYNPDFSAHLGSVINYKNKLFFTLRTEFISACDAQFEYSPSGVVTITDRLPARLGAAVGAEYIYSSAVSFFARMDNINTTRFYHWANYPESRFNFMVGLTYTFPTNKKK